MKNKGKKAAICILFVSAACFLLFKFSGQVLEFSSRVVVYSAVKYLPSSFSENFQEESENDESQAEKEQTKESEEKTEKETTTKKAEEKTEAVNVSTEKGDSFFETPEDILKLIETAKKNSSKDKKDGTISERQYVDEGVTDKSGVVKIKNTNKTKINAQSLLNEKADLSVNKEEPSVLIFHTHTTESYQYLDRNFYAVGYTARSNDLKKNVARVGDAIAEEIEKAGYKVIHDTTIYDTKYTGAYERSRNGISEILKKYPSIQVILDIHRDAIEQTDGTKIKPTATISGKKAAQVMIISGCQEDGNGIENFADWKYNLIFAAQLQQSMEENFPGLTRPIFFCPRRYNMHMSHCSLLLEVGSDSNTLEEAYFSGKCIGKSLAKLLEKYTEEK